MSQVTEPNGARATMQEPITHTNADPPHRRGVGVEARAGWRRRITTWTLLLLGTAWALTSPVPRLLPAQEAKTEADGDAVIVEWRTLAGLDLRTGKAGPELAAVGGKLVKVPGYIVPLEDDNSEFLLVPYIGACIHVPPPPANQMIYVRMPPDAMVEVDPWGWDPIYAVGTLEIARYDSVYGAVGFRMTGLRTETYVWDD